MDDQVDETPAPIQTDLKIHVDVSEKKRQFANELRRLHDIDRKRPVAQEPQAKKDEDNGSDLNFSDT